jgi:O-antigen ligase
LDKTIKDVKHFNAPPIKGKGERRIFWRNTLKIIENNPILGVGVGDFPEEYNKVNKKFTPLAKTTVQPHNMFLFLYASSGILAFLAIIILLFYQVLMGLNSKDEYKPIKLIFPIFFFIIMLTDSYLLGHFTTILFITFSAILYKDATWKILKAGK